MSPTKRSEHRGEIDVEQEVDFRPYFRALVRGWWLIGGGLVIGAVLAVALTLGSGKLYKAKATIYLGQPTAVNNSAQIQTLATNPSTVNRIVQSHAVLAQVSKESGLALDKLSSGVSTATVSGFQSKLGQTPLVTVSVQAHAPKQQVEDAANDLAKAVVERDSTYPLQKIAVLEDEIASYTQEIAAIDRNLEKINSSIASGSSAGLDQQVALSQAAVSEQRRGTIMDELQQAKLMLVQVREVEMGSIVTEAAAKKTSARSRKNSAIVGGALGLLVGALGALALPGLRRNRLG
jgi:hypothetical protein